ncbi:MAG: radical SAM protein [Candidatus Omnitrophota bacterium]
MRIKTQNETYQLLKPVSLVLPEKIAPIYLKEFGVDKSAFETRIIDSLHTEITDRTITRNLSNVRSLILELTQTCNNRCTYCIYSGIYRERRNHSDKNMSLAVGQKAIDFFLHQLHSPLRINREYPSISFFGGEPLMNYDTLIALIDYAQNHMLSRQIKIKFLATINGTLLSPDRIDEIVKKGLRLDVSLDGPKSEHDKFRLSATHEGTWDTIMTNLSLFHDKYPDYFKNYIRFFLTLHPLHNILEIEKFLLNTPFFNKDNVIISRLNRHGLKIDQLDAFKEGRRKMDEQIRNCLQKDQWFYRKLRFDYIEDALGRETSFLSYVEKFTGTCVPGATRLFIDATGNFHICERINNHFPIGNIDTGFDYPAIRNMMIAWRKEIVKRACWTCPAWHFCPFCFAQNNAKGQFKLKTADCNQLKKNIIKDMADYLSDKEAQNVQGNHSGLLLSTNITLFPFVHDVNGRKKRLFVDLLNERLFHIEPGDMESVTRQLIALNLVHETRGIIPFKNSLNIKKNYRAEIRLRTVFLRLTGECDEACQSCGICSCFKSKGTISNSVIERIIDQLKNIPLDQLILSGGNPFLEMEKMKHLLTSISAQKYGVVFKGKVEPLFNEELVEKGVELNHQFRDAIPAKEKMKADAFTFFYLKSFNPCWGNALAINSDGRITPCPCSTHGVGHVMETTIRELIVSEAFDPYWELSKDHIDTCKECEFRYSCVYDCRVRAYRETGQLNSKNTGCSYNPQTGDF